MSFEIENRSKLVIIRCAGKLVRDTVLELSKTLEEAQGNKFSEDFKAIVLDLKKVSEVDNNFLRLIAQFSKSLKSQKKNLFGLNMPTDIQTYIKEKGLEGCLPSLNLEVSVTKEASKAA